MPDNILSRVLHRDGLVLVIDKPAGLPVHPGPKGGPNLTAMLGELRFGLPRSPELAHRLDKDTSGCLVLGRHPRALRTLNALFAEGRVGKTYWAIVEGGPAGEEGLIDLPLIKRSPERGWWMKVDPAGQPSKTRWRVLARSEGRCVLELSPITGRTHQLRVHCAASGYPIAGDPIYGTAPRQGGEALMLHARRVEVPFFPKKEPVVAVAPPPAHMAAALAGMGIAPEAL